jgi:hypothetical protein
MRTPHETAPGKPWQRAAELAAAVSEPELLRLMGLPRGRALEGDLRSRADEARAWYGEHGRPFAAALRVGVDGFESDAVRLTDGTELRSPALAEDLRDVEGSAVLVLAASAGREVAAEIARRWADARPDEAWFLDRFAAAATEALVLLASAAACREASGAGETLLPPRSPGCGGFEMADQHRLMALLGAVPAPNERMALGPIELLRSGALDPPHSLLAALGVTRRPLPATTPEALCRGCALDPCRFRRAPQAATKRPVRESDASRVTA